MTLNLYNTMSRKKEPFEPLEPDTVGMYVCGPTVYDFAHIGNARPVIVFDVLYRLLKRLYPYVTYVRNITDVDDKINAAAKAGGEEIGAITERTIKAFHEDMAALGALEPDVEPRATDHVPQMLITIQALIKSGHAYEADDHVLFSVPAMARYGRLSRHNRDELVAGARVEVAPYKKDPADFVLWKPSTPDLPGWESPWGRGRPGWHIECSAMSNQYLGTTFDIHGGGQDLIFPHHENEIAQSTCANGPGTFARFWMHNGYLMVNGEKMSKSLGNFFTVRELLAKAPGEALRLCMLSTHYRQPLNWTDAGLHQAREAMDRFHTALRHSSEVEAIEVEVPAPVMAALGDDLNTPLAITHLHELAHDLNRAATPREKARLKSELLAAGAVLGILQGDSDAWFKWKPSDAQTLDESAIDALIAARTEARRSRDFQRADEIRDELAAHGIQLEDGPEGTTWRRG